MDEKQIANWLDWLKYNKNRADSTVNKYGYFSGELLKFLRETDKSLMTATTDDLEDYCGLRAHQMGLAPQTRTVIVATVKGLFNWLEREGIRKDNPSTRVPYPRTPSSLPIGIEMKNLNKLIMDPGIDTLVGLRDTLILMILAGCGIRVSGLCNLNEGDLIWTELDGKNLLQLIVEEKGKKRRIVPAPPHVWVLMRAYLNHPDLEKINRDVDDGDRVLFVSFRSNIPKHEYYGEQRRLHPRSVRKILANRGKHALIPPDQCHPHALRHTFGTEMAESDVHISVTQTLMGHEQPQTTMLYTKVATKRLAKAVLKANPLAKMSTPVDKVLKELDIAG